MFRASRALLLLEGLKQTTHHGVFTEFTRRFVATKMLSEELSGDFERAMGTRMKSDYQSGFRVSEEEAEWTIESATAFVEAVADLFARLSTER